MADEIVRVNPEEIVPSGSDLTPIPQVVEIKQRFVDRYKALLGDRYDTFLQYSLSYARKAIRVNTLKITPEALQERLARQWTLTPVPWTPEGFYITFTAEERFDIGNLPEHQLGYFYVQDAASMLPPLVLAPAAGDAVLDMCAAPGSKTTQLAALMHNTGTILANDVSGSRMKALGLNLQRCGVTNTISVLHANRRVTQAFDKVLVDTPCSATGTIRRSLKALQMWSPGFVSRMANEQRRIMEQGWAALKPGGVMVYSTCSLEPEENEGNVSWFLARHEDADLDEISLDIVRSDSVMQFEDVSYDARVAKCLRIFPQDNDTEGFFVARIVKTTSLPSQSSRA